MLERRALGEAEVAQIRVRATGLAVDQNVRRLDVAVHETALVRDVECGRYLLHDRESTYRLERALASEQRFQVRTFDEAHRDVELPVGLAGVVDRNHVRVVDRGRQLALAEKPVPKPSIRRQLRRQDLQRNRPIQRHVLRPIDHAHAAPADKRLHAVAGQRGTDPGVGCGAHITSRTDDRASAHGSHAPPTGASCHEVACAPNACQCLGCGTRSPRLIWKA